MKTIQWRLTVFTDGEQANLADLETEEVVRIQEEIGMGEDRGTIDRTV